MKLFSKAPDIKMATIGYSPAYNMGRQHLTNASKYGAVPTAVCDINPDCLAQARADFPGIHTYQDVEEMLAAEGDLGLVVIITPHNTHHKLALRCLEAGIHVVVEKPFAVTVSEVEEMMATAKEKGLVITAYHNRHWDGSVMEALRRVQSGAIGELVRIEAHMGRWDKPGDWWRSSRSISGGTLYDWGVHLLEYSFQLIPAKVIEVSGYHWTGFWGPKTRWKDDANEDEASALVRFDNGAFLNLRITSLDADPRPGMLQITGTLGSYRMDHRVWEHVRRTDSGTVVRETGQNPDGETHRFYENLIFHLTGGEELVITPEWSRRPIEVLELAVRSAQERRALAPEVPI